VGKNVSLCSQGGAAGRRRVGPTWSRPVVKSSVNGETGWGLRLGGEMLEKVHVKEDTPSRRDELPRGGAVVGEMVRRGQPICKNCVWLYDRQKKNKWGRKVQAPDAKLR